MTDVECAANLRDLRVQKLIPASPERVFCAWTDPDELKKWWGPKGVRCVSAEVDLKIGGQYRIANKLPDGTILWIAGEFEIVERPHLLTYTWIVKTENPSAERVSVRFEPHDVGTEIILTHELISTAALRDQHQQGWYGCMQGLHDHLTELSP